MPELSLPTLYPDRCTACGLCLTACPGGVLALLDLRPILAHPECCTYCGLCEEVCPAEAVELYYEIVCVVDAGTAEGLGEKGDSP